MADTTDYADFRDLPLFKARTTDPETSKAGAVYAAPSLPELQRWAAQCVIASPGRTANELAALYCPTDPRTIGRRLGEAERKGLVRRGTVRKCERSGRQAATWWPVGGA